MNTQFSLRAVLSLAVLSLAMFPLVLPVAESGAAKRASDKRASDKKKVAPEIVDFFSAIDAEQIHVTAIPRDSKRITLQVENKTEKPLKIRLPNAFAAVPVLAQFGRKKDRGFGQGLNLDFGENNQNGGNQNGGGSQAVGGGFNQDGGQGQDFNAFQKNNNNNPFQFGQNQGGGGFFNIPPGKTIIKRLACVCLEYGKPDPKPRIAYEIRPLESVNDNPKLRILLARLGQGRYEQNIAQLAAWNLANGVSFEKLATEKIRFSGSLSKPRYSQNELRLAQRILKQLPSRKTKEPKQPSLSLLLK